MTYVPLPRTLPARTLVPPRIPSRAKITEGKQRSRWKISMVRRDRDENVHDGCDRVVWTSKTTTMATMERDVAVSSEAHDALPRCDWVGRYVGASSTTYVRYHDEEWGTPLHGEQALFELLCLEGMQAGLTWAQVLHRREAFRAAFHHFDVDRVAAMTAADVDALMGPESGVIRHRRKLTSIVQNAKAVQALRDVGGLDHYLWSHVDHRPLIHQWRRACDVPSQTPLSVRLSRALKRRGFAYVGPTTTYAFLQGAGLVWDHLQTCHRRPAHPSHVRHPCTSTSTQAYDQDDDGGGRDDDDASQPMGCAKRGALRTARASGRRDLRTSVPRRGRRDTRARGVEESADGQREERRVPHHRHTRDQDPQEAAPQKRRATQRNRHLQRYGAKEAKR